MSYRIMARARARELRAIADREPTRRAELMSRALRLDPGAGTRVRRAYQGTDLARSAAALEHYCPPCDSWEAAPRACR